MHKVSLKFPSKNALVDFLFVCLDCEAAIKHSRLTLSGFFKTRDLELAMNGFGATVIIKVKKEPVESKPRYNQKHLS
jgi:hypothetical protein